jgi:glutamate dehydrogenase (NAD(P)+)
VVFLIEKWAEEHDLKLDGATYFVQGFGNVGSWVSRLMKTHGARLLAVEDVSGAIHCPEGIDAEALHAYAQEHGQSIKGYPHAEAVDHDTFLSTRADIFVPAALEEQITSETAPLLNVRVVAEGANGPTDPEGDTVLQERGIQLIPDILCNSGGVIVSYFEWLQNKRSEFWELEEVDTKLRKRIADAYDRVREASQEHQVDWRTAAYIVALSRLEIAYKERGIFP